MQAIQQRASELQAQTLALEVLKSNTAAQKLYLSLGYRQVRDLLIWEHRPDGRQTANGSDLMFSRTDPRHLLEILGQWQPYDPPWQRSRHAIARLLLDSVGFRLESQAGELLGCVICQPLNINRKDERVRIVGMAVDPRREVVHATEDLLQALRLHFDGMLLTLLNEPSDSCATPALQACSFEVVEEQYEMILHLT